MSTVPDPLLPRRSVGRVLSDLGATLLELLHGDPEPSAPVGAVVIHDPVDPPFLPARAVVLGVGVDTPEDVVALLGRMAGQGVVALVLREPAAVDDTVRAAADAAGVAVLGLRTGVPWIHLTAMLRSLLAEGEVEGDEAESLGGLPSGDLFAVANAVASLLDAPVTIEDRDARVLAFSGRQDEADASRVETILGRQVPERYFRNLTERGVFRELYRSDGPVYVDPIEVSEHGLSMLRVAMAVRAGDEVLGSIWAAVPERLGEERTAALVEAGTLVALHMLRVRAGADAQRRVRADLVSSVLEGGPGARAAVERLGLGDGPLVVLGFALGGSEAGGDAGLAHERQRLGDAFAMHLGAVTSRSATALLGGVAYGLVSGAGTPGEIEERGVRLAGDFLTRVGDRFRPFIAVGPVATAAQDVARSRAATDRILRVLREGRAPGPVARLADVQTESLVLELRDLAAARQERPQGVLARLIEYDRDHNGRLVPTLSAWLDAFGDVGAASEAVFVHPNTFRYRLRRVAEVGEVDLTDARQRFALMVQLAVLDS
ncbi:helix-turn-helix domain-containing protein [Phycicoccus sp. CSK15P-2]|uniref:PucR family transcriptional regulator n=1 Tax=Phycicoccus sp. CSK15P-2 TaxID=2807627 RepID=UPI00194F40C0|nr:helix-turn-helix domain-containing protein [Phycicoccus sp. CSK15P-2]MBM6404545.1 helix-turn-helix domain-containing protein [Phycicoccus sp. CSK15P-2]